jgi:hypothetical protein
MVSRGRLMAAFSAVAISVALLASPGARAAYGSPSHDPYFDWSDISRGVPTEQRQQLLAIKSAAMAARQSLDQQIRAIRTQMTDQLSGPGTADPAQLYALQTQIFALRRQGDQADLAEALQIRGTLTPAELAADGQRHARLRSLSQSRDEILNPTSYPKICFEVGDLFGDALGVERGVSLSDEQQQRMTAIMASNTAMFTAIQAQRAASRAQIVDLLMGSAAVTAAQFAPLLDQAASLKEQMDDARLTMVLQLRAVLTPDQLAQAASLHQRLVEIRAAEAAVNNPSSSAN